jgi:transposase
MCALVIRDDISSEELRRQARQESIGRVAARLFAIANALEGMDRARHDGQTLRDWVHRYNEEGIAGLSNRPLPGRSPKLTEGQMAALKAVVLAGPDPAVDDVVRWRIIDLCRWVDGRWGVSYSETGMLRLLWSLDLSHRKTRPRHPQTDESAQQAFKKDPMGCIATSSMPGGVTAIDTGTPEPEFVPVVPETNAGSLLCELSVLMLDCWTVSEA